MAGFIEGVDRHHSKLFSVVLDDYIGDDNPVRAVDVFVDSLDLAALGFEGVEPLALGRPAYRPATLLKIYIYGYLNRVPSSRRLERECQRNIELIWLTGRLAPDFKTIADFRKDNGGAIVKVCREFVMLCRKLGLLSEASVAIDGSKFKAVNARDKNFTEAKMKRRLERIEAAIARYLSQLETADRQGDAVPEGEVARLKDRIAKLKEETECLNAINAEMMKSEDKQVSLTDPDARDGARRPFRRHGRLQCAKRGGHEKSPHRGASSHQYGLGSPPARNHGRAGAHRHGGGEARCCGRPLLLRQQAVFACEEAGITVTLPKPLTSGAKAAGRFGKQDFVYVAAQDVYRCPAGERLTYRSTSEENGKVMRRYWTTVCQGCALKAQCTTGTERRIPRWEHEAVLERVQDRLDRDPDKMGLRRQTAEHPFGTIKAWMGATHFQMRTLPKVTTEMALNVLAYNMKRVMALVGVATLMEAARA